MNAPRVISLIGLPGAGKTTLGKALTRQLGQRCTYFGVGEVLRQRAQVDASLRKQLEDGELGPEAVVTRVVREALSVCTTELFIVDGFPRHTGQLAFAREYFVRWKVLWLEIARDRAVERLSGRRSCAVCGAPAQGSEQSGVCPVCRGRTWKGRAEDADAVLQRRLDGAEADLQKLLAEMEGTLKIKRLDSSVSVRNVVRFALAAII